MGIAIIVVTVASFGSVSLKVLQSSLVAEGWDLLPLR